MKLLRAFGRTILGVLRELGDEGPYRRHLAVHGRKDTPEEWRRFSEERLTAKYKRPKCC
jgi:hypothetical protein